MKNSDKTKAQLVLEVTALRKRCAALEITANERKRLETEIQDAREYAESIVETVREPLVVLNSDLRILTANHSFYDTFKGTPEETIGNFIYDLGNRQWDIPKLRVLIEEILPHDTVFNGYEVEHDFLDIGRKVILLNARQIFRENIGSHIILLAMEDITERKQLETEIQDAREYAENIVETVREPMVVLNSDLKILTANHSFYDTFKGTPEETIGHFIYDLGNRQWDIPKLRVLFEEILPHDTVFNSYEVEHDFLDIGRKIILLNARQIFRENIGSHIILLAMEDITERKLVEERIGEVIRQQQAILDNIPNIAWLKDKKGRYVAVNDPFGKAFGAAPKDLVGKKDHDIYSPEMALKYEKDSREVMATGTRTYFEESTVDREGKIQYVEKIETPIFNDAGMVIGIIGIAHDITSRKEVEATLRHDSTHDMLTGLHNRAFFDEELERLAHGGMFPVSIVMADVNGLKTVNDTLGHDAGDNLIQLAARIILGTFRAEDIVARIGGDEFAVLLPGTDKDVAEESVKRIMSCPEIINGLVSIAFGIATAENKDQFAEALKLSDERMYRDKSAQKESQPEGANRHGEIRMKYTAKTVKAQTGTPISDQTGVEQALRNSELRYRRLFESAQDGILILNAETGSISDVNPYLIDMLGYSREEFVEKKLWEVGAFKDIEASRNAFLALQKNEFIRYENLPLKTKDGRLVQVEFVSNVYLVGDEKVIQCNIRDISDRKRAEAASLAKEEDHWLMIKNLPAGVIVHAPDTRIVRCNPEASQLLGISSDQMLGKDASDPEWHFVREDGTRMPVDEFPVRQVIAKGRVLKNFIMGITRGRAEENTWVLVNAYPEFGSGERLRQIVVMFTDISDIKRAEERIRRHLEHLTALVEIDRAINFSFDLNLSLATLLTHVIVQLGVDAADVLLFNPMSRTLEYVVGRGFHTKAIEHAHQPLGEGYAGRAAQERSIVHIPDLAKEHDSFLRGILLAGEDFVSYYGVPLIAKGQVMGVLEVFQRAQLEHGEEWLDFLKALAAQAAIAIDNVTLFDNLQRSNTELAEAYDATIEGWSRALELRDNETEGHTQRVADLTVKLARVFGLSEAELVQVRWGALLHDIGKMAIPDGILLKHDTLTEAEWVVMKKHTVFAYEMLCPIRYLRSALDIPYAHHEKWDGTGYPLGLKGEQIPLVARIFAVVDVWDALRSDRLYRTSWSEEKVREHIRSLAGTHFDPHVVNVCLDSDILVV